MCLVRIYSVCEYVYFSIVGGSLILKFREEENKNA